MLAQISIKTLSAVAVSAVLAGMIVALTSAAPQALAQPQTDAGTHQPAAKADRLPARTTGASCSAGAWPYDRNCQFDHRQAADGPRSIRIIALR
jgi:hypothetical protein